MKVSVFPQASLTFLTEGHFTYCPYNTPRESGSSPCVFVCRCTDDSVVR